jgi:hypothetical protein
MDEIDWHANFRPLDSGLVIGLANETNSVLPHSRSLPLKCQDYACEQELPRTAIGKQKPF